NIFMANRKQSFVSQEHLVNTPPRLKSCGFWANPPVGKLSAQGLIPAPLEDDDRGVVVPIKGHAAIAFDPTIPERKMLEPGTATRGSSSTIRSNRVINSWTNLLRKSFRALATWTIRRCSLRISRRRLRLPSTHRAIFR